MIPVAGGVLCCGNMVQDILVRPVSAVVFDTTTWVDSIGFATGGNGANTSHALALLEAPVRLYGFAGDDEFGDRVLATLGAAGVDISLVQRTAGEATATSIVIVHPSGSRAFLHQPGVNLRAFRDPVSFTPELVEGSTHFHLANPFGLVELRKRGGDVLRAARAAGLTTSLDTGWDARGQWMEVIGPCLPHTDLLFMNEDESRMLSGWADPRLAARFFQEQGVGAVVVKLGAKGCYLADGDTSIDVPAFAVAAVDSTGAGDSFAGGFLAGLHHGMSACEAARLANAVGALSVSKLGAVAGLLPLRETLAWMERTSSSGVV